MTLTMRESLLSYLLHSLHYFWECTHFEKWINLTSFVLFCSALVAVAYSNTHTTILDVDGAEWVDKIQFWLCSCSSQTVATACLSMADFLIWCLSWSEEGIWRMDRSWCIHILEGYGVGEEAMGLTALWGGQASFVSCHQIKWRLLVVLRLWMVDSALSAMELKRIREDNVATTPTNWLTWH